MNGISHKDIIGKCCNENPYYIIKYNGAPSTDYFVLICKIHLNKKPFDQNILSVEEWKNKERKNIERSHHA